MSENKKFRVAIVGNPNSGKTTLFNGLTGSNQRVGNWPGVTVEKTIGYLTLEDFEFEIIDLPGIYSLSSDSIDEKIARDFIIKREYDAIINILDSSNLERNLFLTLNLLEMKVPVILVLNKIDIVKKNNKEIDPKLLSELIGLQVVAINSTKKEDVEYLKKMLPILLEKTNLSNVKIPYHNEIEVIINKWRDILEDLAGEMNVSSRWIAIKILEKDELIVEKVTKLGILTKEDLDEIYIDIENILKDSTEVLIFTEKYAFIKGLVKQITKVRGENFNISDKIDKIVMNKILGIPIFLGIMYFMFLVVINLGGAFVDFFDIFFGTIFVNGFRNLLTFLKFPEWSISFFADGIGAGIQTVSTFIPIMFLMFFMLSLLEDSGYMARAAFVMDRFMRFIGLPGKAFVPLIVGFGCTVPAVLSTRTLESTRERFLTVFMAPLMSCSARLPVYALFGVIFFGENAGIVTFSLYIVGILIAILTGLFLKKTLFKGEANYFVMELPPYNTPRLKHIFIRSWIRLNSFIKRAGINIIVVVTLLGFLNTIKISNEQTVLAEIGKTITPVFEPMGVEKENWPATVGLFTGIFAKEAIIGTLNSLYSQLEFQKQNGTQSEEDNSEEESFDFWGQIKEAFLTIPENLKGIVNSFLDPLGLGIVSSDEKAVAKELEVNETILLKVREKFKNQPLRAYAYLLFVLIYFPCVAAFGAILKEIGWFYGILSVLYLTVLGWIVATIFYQLTIGHSLLWIMVASLVLILVGFMFYVIGRKKQME